MRKIMFLFALALLLVPGIDAGAAVPVKHCGDVHGDRLNGDMYNIHAKGTSCGKAKRVARSYLLGSDCHNVALTETCLALGDWPCRAYNRRHFHGSAGFRIRCTHRLAVV